MVSYSAQTFSTPVIWVFRPTGENSGLTMWHRIPHVYVGKPFFELAMHCLVSANQNTPCESRISKCSNIKIRSFSFWKLDYFVRWPLWKSTFDTTKFLTKFHALPNQNNLFLWYLSQTVTQDIFHWISTPHSIGEIATKAFLVENQCT